MGNILFLTEQYIKDNTIIDPNVDMKVLRVAIVDAQEKYIHPLLGTALYEQLESQIDSGTVSTLNGTLLRDYVQKALKFWTLFQSVDVLTFKFTNKTVGKKNSENTESASLEEIARLMEKWRDDAEWWSERTTKFLKQNPSDYPLYLTPGNGIDTIHPNGDNFTCSIYLGSIGCD